MSQERTYSLSPRRLERLANHLSQLSTCRKGCVCGQGKESCSSEIGLSEKGYHTNGLDLSDERDAEECPTGASIQRKHSSMDL